MSDIKDLFVSYEIAKQLKEKGFDEECLAIWFKKELLLPETSGFNWLPKDAKQSHSVLAPLYQQVVDWFREKHLITIKDDSLKIGEYSFCTRKQDYSFMLSFTIKMSTGKTYYEALTKAIEEAIKLIR